MTIFAIPMKLKHPQSAVQSLCQRQLLNLAFHSFALPSTSEAETVQRLELKAAAVLLEPQVRDDTCSHSCFMPF